MRTLLNAATFCFLLLSTLGSGWLHGRMVNRWGETSALKRAAELLNDGLPARLGPWRLAKTHDLEQGVADVLQCVACLHGVYTNDQTGDTVVVAVVAGPGGRISVHTPEICYAASDYTMAGERQQINVEDQNGQIHTLWQLQANSQQPTRPNLRVLYGWNAGETWQAVTGPRFAFAGLPVLYKLQLAGPPRDNQPDRGSDPCQDFLSRFLAQLQPRLISTSRISLLAN